MFKIINNGKRSDGDPILPLCPQFTVEFSLVDTCIWLRENETTDDSLSWTTRY